MPAWLHCLFLRARRERAAKRYGASAERSVVIRCDYRIIAAIPKCEGARGEIGERLVNSVL
jgi:hypothetical protein